MASPIVMPSFGMYTAEGTLVSWLHAAGASVEKGEPVLEIETDKATYEVPAPESGLLHQVVPAGAAVSEQMVIGFVLAHGEEAPGLEAEAVQSDSIPAPPAPGQASGQQAARDAVTASAGEAGRINASPIARRLSRELDVPLEDVIGTGPGGRVVEADILAFANRPTSVPADHAALFGQWRIRDRVPLSGIRRATAARLKQGQSAAVSLTLTREVPAGALLAAHSDLSRRVGESVAIDAFFVKFLALGLREQPDLNALVSDEELMLLEDVNIGVATAVSDGLLVPVIREADSLTVTEINRRIRELAQRAREGKITVADMEGGTSTLTNLGAFGVDAFTPVLNPPQSSILGIGRIAPRAAADGDSVRLVPTVWLSLTFDHRVTDGVPAARLLDAIARRVSGDVELTDLDDER